MITVVSHFSLPQMPFDKVVTEWPSIQRVEETAKIIDKNVEKYKYTDAYTYHPHNMNKQYPQRQGENVSFIIA